MLVFDEKSEPKALNDFNLELVSINYFWVLDCNLMDFLTVPLQFTEQWTCPALELSFGLGAGKIIIPADWFILLVGEDTCTLDSVEAHDVTGKDFSAFVYGPKMKNFAAAQISTTNFFPNFATISPALQKHQMLCYPISRSAWVCVTPYDVYSKYLKNKFAGDLI